MSKRKKTTQDNSFDGSKIIVLPILKRTGKRPSNVQDLNEDSSSSAVFKRPRIITVPGETILANFRLTMHGCIASKITSIVKNTEKGNVMKKIDDLKLKSINDKRLLLGMISDIAKAPGCLPNTISGYLERNLPTKNSVAWNQYVEEHFEGIVKTILSKNVSSSDQPKDEAPAEKVNQSAKKVRLCSTSMNKIIRSDLPIDIRSNLMNNFQETMVKTSTNIANFSEIVFLIMLLFKNGGLILKDNKPIFDHSVTGLNLATGILFYNSAKIRTPPVSISALNSKSTSEINNLFQEAHLSLIHSHFFLVSEVN